MKKYHKGTHLENLAWGATKACRQVEKQYFLDKMQEGDPAAKAWLDMEPHETWCRSHFDFTSKCEHITNNFSESFNWWIVKIRDKPLDKAIERLNLMLMKLHNKRRIKARAWDQRGLVPKALMHIEKLKIHYGEYDFEGEDDDGFVSIGTNGGRWKLNLLTHTCECNEWHLSGLPCIHAASVIIPMSKYHHVSSYAVTYSGVVHVVTDSSNWGKLQNLKHGEVKIEAETMAVAVAEAMTLLKKVKHLMFVLVEEEVAAEAVAEAMTLFKKVKHLIFVLVEEEVVAEVVVEAITLFKKVKHLLFVLVEEEVVVVAEVEAIQGLMPSLHHKLDLWMTTHPNIAGERTLTQPSTQTSQTASAIVNLTPPNPTRTKENPYKKTFNACRQPWKH
ncbi:hypothetical protein GIB67_029021 [Kingdonia uniflora]|uniref:SWIM-type domain-containing protein n=1 Tax=Kingdonia uniflora TaxID=39325 RepID=A0A7J7N6T3_9MAGN|nr:hypothetical protein GIB67_029021 [Kingdonia uniflora]